MPFLAFIDNGFLEEGTLFTLSEEGVQHISKQIQKLSRLIEESAEAEIVVISGVSGTADTIKKMLKKQFRTVQAYYPKSYLWGVLYPEQNLTDIFTQIDETDRSIVCIGAGSNMLKTLFNGSTYGSNLSISDEVHRGVVLNYTSAQWNRLKHDVDYLKPLAQRNAMEGETLPWHDVEFLSSDIG